MNKQLHIEICTLIFLHETSRQNQNDLLIYCLGSSYEIKIIHLNFWPNIKDLGGPRKIPSLIMILSMYINKACYLNSLRCWTYSHNRCGLW